MLASLRIDLSALRANARRLRALVAPAQLGAVVKANAYGHGLVEVARALDGCADRLCVYAPEEALELRAAGVTAPILVMGPTPRSALTALLLESGADPRGERAARSARHARPPRGAIATALWDVDAYARTLGESARRCGRTAEVHVKVNTGLGRLGLEPAALPAAVAAYRGMPELRIEGIFSHLAAAEELDSDFTLEQLRRFDDAVTRARCGPVLRHIAATAAAMLWPQTRLDLVRVGIGLYGLWPSPETRRVMERHGFALEPVLSWRSELVAVRDVDADTPIGYGLTHHTATPARVGIVPIGYAEGVPRLASNRAEVLVAGHRCPIIGRVCMDMLFVDLSAVPDAHPGMTVTLIGRDGDARIDADDWARWCETINYEIVARLPREVPRHHVADLRADVAAADAARAQAGRTKREGAIERLSR